MDHRITTGDDYKPGNPEDLAVCFFLREGSAWAMVKVATRAEADAEFKAALGRDDVLRVQIDAAGHTSPVVWLAKCQGGSRWLRVKETPGARSYMEVDE